MIAFAAAMHGERIILRAADLTGIPVEMIVGPRRTSELAQVRFACMAAMRAKGMSYPQIGRRFSRDHTTAMFGVDRAKALQSDPHFEALIHSLEAA